MVAGALLFLEAMTRRRDLLYVPARALWYFLTHPRLWLIIPAAITLMLCAVFLMLVACLMMAVVAVFMVTIVPWALVALIAAIIFGPKVGGRIMNVWADAFADRMFGGVEKAFDGVDRAFDGVDWVFDWIDRG